jgi:hypothetical protein
VRSSLLADIGYVGHLSGLLCSQDAVALRLFDQLAHRREPDIDGRWTQFPVDHLGAILHQKIAGEWLLAQFAEGEDLIQRLGIVAPCVR